MKKFIIGVLAIGALSVQASMLEVNGPLDATLFEAQVSDDKTYFETLGDLYSKGALPDISKLQNKAWAGRCFWKTNPNEPTAGGFIFRVKKGANVGPIGVGKVSYEATAYSDSTQSPDFFDQVTLKDVLNILSGVTFFNAKILPDSILVANGMNSGRIKLSGKYLVLELHTTDPKAGDNAINGVFVRCYYFIPEYINN